MQLQKECVTGHTFQFEFSGEEVFWASQNSKYPKCQDQPKFEFGRGGYSGQVKTQNTLSAKISLNLNLGGEGILGKSKLKIP